MSQEFPKFGKIVNTSFQKIVASKKVFEVSLTGDELFAAYLATFPEGTNPMFKVRTEHECSCCRHFIKRAGTTVTTNEKLDGLKTVWDEAAEKAPYPYNVVAAKMRDMVKAAPISDLYLVGQKETSFGAEKTVSEDKETKAAVTWNHFFTGEVPVALRSDKVDSIKGAYRTSAQVFERGLKELKPEALETVLSLIAENNLYRGDENKAAVKSFYDSQKSYLSKSPIERQMFVWFNADGPASRLRNTAMGTLLQDLSEGKELEHAVNAFETMVNGANYKRPKALITPMMIKQAMETLQKLDLEAALERRFAVIGDISVNDVKWVAGRVKPLMKGGLMDKLLDHATAAIDVEKEEKRAETIGMEAFVNDILPTATQVDVLLRTTHLGSLVSLTAPVHPENKRLFKWNNDFAWSYVGGMADSELRRAVQTRGGRVDGAFRFSHSWNYDKRNASLMDLHVFMPGSDMHGKALNCTNDCYGNDERVGWNHRQHSRSGGTQDVDYTAAAPEGYMPVENTTFPDLRKMPEGRYLCKIHNWNFRHPTQGGFRAEVEFGGQVFAYEYDRPLKNKEWVAVATVTLKSGAFTIEHHLPCGSAPQEKWGLKTEQYVPVNAVTLSPNYWGNNAVGNKHTFFLLEGAKNDEPTRGIYNEFLNSKLEPHRKVFEVIGEKTKCQPTEGQLSGVGFSSTKHETVIVKVQQGKKQRVFSVKTGA